MFDARISGGVGGCLSAPNGVPSMTPERLTADLAFIGHKCLDEVIPFGGSPRVAPGSAVLCGALAATGVGTSVGVVIRMAPHDEAILSGDTVFAVHIARRLGHDPDDSLSSPPRWSP